MTYKKWIGLVFCFLIIPNFLAAQNPKKQKQSIDTFLKEIKKVFPEIPGVSIAIVKDNKKFLIGGYGYADLVTKEPVTKSTQFYLASNTKSYTGILASIMEEDGLIDLSKPITHYKPFNQLSNSDLFQNVTISELLSHTSGLSNNFISFRTAYIDQPSSEEIKNILEKATRSGKKEYLYDNLGFILFDILLKEEFGKDWKAQMNQRLFIPYGLKETYSDYSRIKENTKDLAQPYIAGQAAGVIKQSLKKEELMHAAGGLISNGNDAAKFLLLNLDKENIAFISTHKTIAELTPSDEQESFIPVDGYGLGWTSGHLDDNEILFHSGSYTGYQSHFSFIPNENMGIAIMTNEQFFGDNLIRIIVPQVYAILLGNKLDHEVFNEQKNTLRQLINSFEKSAKSNLNSNSSDKDLPTLKFPLRIYTGSYENEFMGKVSMIVKDDKLYVTMGVQNSDAEVLADHKIRVELVKGRRMDFEFEVIDNAIVGFNAGGLEFIKIDE